MGEGVSHILGGIRHCGMKPDAGVKINPLTFKARALGRACRADSRLTHCGAASPSTSACPARANARAFGGARRAVRKLRLTLPMCRTKRSHQVFHHHQIHKTPHEGALCLSGGEGGLIRHIHVPFRPVLAHWRSAARGMPREFPPYPLRGGFAVHIGNPADVSNQGFSSSPPSPSDKQNAPRGGALLIWRRGGDSNPRYAHTYA